MAKQIKVIKCPQCGSVNKSQIKDEHYVCTNCGTEYFLDNDDVTIHHNVNVNNSGFNSGKAIKIIKIVAIVFGVIIALKIIIGFVTSIFSVKSPEKVSFETYTPASTPPEEEKIIWNNRNTYFFQSANKKPIIIVIGTRKKDKDYSAHALKLYAGFYEGITGKEIKITELNINAKKCDVEYKEFEDNNLYFIFNKAKLFVVDKQLLEVKEVSPETYQNLRGLESGIAKIEFVYEKFGSGFKVLSNEGEELYYYPIIQKIYTADNFEAAREGFSSIPKNTSVFVDFIFSEMNHHDPVEKLRLIKFHHKSPPGYPRSILLFIWLGEFASSGDVIFLEGKRYTPQIMKNISRIVDYKDFTPGRLYFAPSVLSSNDKHVLISFKPTPAEDAPTSLQLLNAENAEILWTKPFEERIDEVFEYDDGYCVRISSYKYVFINLKGEQVASVDISEQK